MKFVLKAGRIALQVGLLFLFVLAGDAMAAWLHLQKIPGDIIGLLLLFLFLQLKIIKLAWVEEGANWLLAELLLFFVPSAVGVIQYKQLIENRGLQILVVIVLSTMIVMLCTGLLAEFLYKRRKEANHGPHHKNL